MKKLISFTSGTLNKIGGAVSGIFILILGVIVTYEVVMRYVFDAPTIWVLEISIYLNIASVEIRCILQWTPLPAVCLIGIKYSFTSSASLWDFSIVLY
jgi:TRAP-type mannitol/chloroaromatic compound transport system permease small subunit